MDIDERLVVEINKKAYASRRVLEYYEGLHDLFPGEKVLFEEFKTQIATARVLDIGIGGGRTTEHLLPIVRDYVGVDYVADYIEFVRERFQVGEFQVADARRLVNFEDSSFDFVLFSYNGIDTVGHDDRRLVLNEIHRVLRKGGIFLFSSHNRDYRFFRKPYWLRDYKVSLTLGKNLLSYLFFTPRRLINRRYEIVTDKYALVNDADHRYSLLVYYISIPKQLEDLTEAGFVSVQAFSQEGVQVTEDRDSYWIYYAAVKN